MKKIITSTIMAALAFTTMSTAHAVTFPPAAIGAAGEYGVNKVDGAGVQVRDCCTDEEIALCEVAKTLMSETDNQAVFTVLQDEMKGECNFCISDFWCDVITTNKYWEKWRSGSFAVALNIYYEVIQCSLMRQMNAGVSDKKTDKINDCGPDAIGVIHQDLPDVTDTSLTTIQSRKIKLTKQQFSRWKP